MSKQVLLSAKTSLTYRGKRQSLGHQFSADPDDAKRFVDGGMAEAVAEPETKAPAAADAPAKK